MGQRPALVFIHGAGGTHLYWPSQLRRLAGYRVYAPDLPGHGKSGGVGRQTILAYAQTMLSWLDAMGFPRAIIAGHSMGSAIALTLALEFPEKVLGLVLVGASARLQVNPTLLEGFSRPTSFLDTVEQTVAWSFSEYAPKRLVELAGKRMAETRQGVLYGDFLACASFDMTDRLAQINQPVLVVCGEQDKMTPCRHAQFMADHLPQSTLKVIPHAGHMVMLEQPEVVAAEVLSFLSKIS